MGDGDVGDEPMDLDSVSDEELAEVALAADADVVIGPDAVPIRAPGRPSSAGLLPDWYMPVPSIGVGLLTGWRRRVVILVITSFLLVNAYGLCSTYGFLGLG